MLGLRFCARAFSSCGKRGPLFIAVRGPLTIAASLVAEHRLQTRRLSSCGSQAQLLHGMWDLPRPGLKPVSPALAGRLSTTAPPGKPDSYNLNVGVFNVVPEVSKTVLNSFYSFFFILLCSSQFHDFIFQVTYPFFCLSSSAIDSFQRIFNFIYCVFIIVCLLFSSSRSLLNVSCIFSILFPRFWIIFTIINKSIETKSHKEAYRYTLTKREKRKKIYIYTYIYKRKRATKSINKSTNDNKL